jgi:hypothetical protein
MDKMGTGGEARADQRSELMGSGAREVERGAVQSFVDMAELRRIMGRLTAIEMLRMLLAPDAPPHGA